MSWKLVALGTDWVVWALVAALGWYAWSGRRNEAVRMTWRRVLHDAPALCAGVVLACFALVTLLDSVHFRRALPAAEGSAAGTVAYSPRTESLLDVVLARPIAMREVSYSVPLATHGFAKETVQRGGETRRDYPRLQFGGAHLADPATQWAGDVTSRSLAGTAGGLLFTLAAAWLVAWRIGAQHGGTGAALRAIAANRTAVPWRALLLTLAVLGVLVGMLAALASQYHVFGTDRTGKDILVLALKSVRTAFVIGTLSTLATLPLAIVLGVLAGYFKGWVDELIQYLYTVLSSVPNVLLIAACVLMVQVFLDKHPEMFETGTERSDVKVFLLCIILGITGWATLCRLVRAETLKLRELDYVQAATAFGVSDVRIMARHILPNVMHLVLITTVLNFSDLVLYEAVLTYVGVGVDASTSSFGGMINLARNEMGKDPVVWWGFMAAFAFMLALVLAANLFADGVRDAFDPRARAFRPRLAFKKGGAA
jgi:peptide/nickel transport system permease protein